MLPSKVIKTVLFNNTTSREYINHRIRRYLANCKLPTPTSIDFVDVCSRGYSPYKFKIEVIVEDKIMMTPTITVCEVDLHEHYWYTLSDYYDERDMGPNTLLSGIKILEIKNKVCRILRQYNEE